MVGAKDFSLFGRPLLPADMATVEATVIEKTLTAADPRFHMVPAKNFHHLVCMSIACVCKRAYNRKACSPCRGAPRSQLSPHQPNNAQRKLIQ